MNQSCIQEPHGSSADMHQISGAAPFNRHPITIETCHHQQNASKVLTVLTLAE